MKINGERIAYVHEYLNLGQLLKKEKEVETRTEGAWKIYWSVKHLTKYIVAHKRKTMDMCILSVLMYG